MVFAAVAYLASIRLFLLAVVILNLECHQIDIKTAFLNVLKTGEKVYVQQLHGLKEGDEVCELLRALYGLRESPSLWYHTFVAVLQELGFDYCTEFLRVSFKYALAPLSTLQHGRNISSFGRYLKYRERV
jgi:hypothetical protein